MTDKSDLRTPPGQSLIFFGCLMIVTAVVGVLAVAGIWVQHWWWSIPAFFAATGSAYMTLEAWRIIKDAGGRRRAVKDSHIVLLVPPRSPESAPRAPRAADVGIPEAGTAALTEG
jgi:hypothetical protein